jgi:hypothetical protein
MSSEDDGDSESEVRESLRGAPSGAPAVGWAIQDRFSANEVFVRVLVSADEEIATDRQQLFSAD